MVSAYPGCIFSRHDWRLWLHAMLFRVRDVLNEQRLPGLTGESGLHAHLHIVRDGDIAAVHAAGLGLTGPTNVLSFPSGAASFGRNGYGLANTGCVEGPGQAHSGICLGEMYLSGDTLVREARLYGQPVSKHAQRLLAHGLAHLLGHDHGPDMDGLCAALLRATGVC